MLESRLQAWRRWGLQQRPAIERPLGLGRTNRSYLIHAGDRRLVLRLNHRDSAELGIDRRREGQILSRVSAAGIAPAVIYDNPAEGVLITEYIPGAHWSADRRLDPEQQSRLLDLMAEVHAVEVDLPRFDYRQQAEDYWRALRGRGVEAAASLELERRRMLPLIEKFQRHCRCRALCHHDPGPANIIDWNGRLYMLDWEYAGLGCPAFDYAALAAEWCLPSPQAVGGLACDLSLAGEVYRYLGLLWQVLRQPG